MRQKVSAQLEASKPAPAIGQQSLSSSISPISRHASPRGGFLFHTLTTL
jgi:hypothetical protein